MSMVCIYRCARLRTRSFIHTAWASVLLFGTKGNTRASRSGTAIVQSRFFLFMQTRIFYTHMKKELFFTITSLISCLPLCAEVNYPALGIDRKVLFTMNEKEFLYRSDFEDKNSFYLNTCFAVDSMFNGDYYEPIYQYSLIVNGDLKCSMANPNNICNLYYDDFSKCMHEYIGQDGGVYVKMGNKSYGPYTKVLLKPRKYPYGNNPYYRTSFEHYKQGQFEFWYDDEHFVREDDGKIHKFSKRRSEYTSPNKKHKVTITNENPLKALSIDGKTYDLAPAIETYWNVNDYYGGCQTIWIDIFDSIGAKMCKTPKDYITDCCIFDDGTCLYRITNTKGRYNEAGEFESYDFYIKGDNIRLLAREIREHEIMDNCNADMDDYYDECCKNHTYYEYYDRTSNNIFRREVMDSENKDKCENMLLVLDKTGKHLIIDVEKKVGFVNDKRIDLDIVLPWSIKFNENKNAFQWVCLENKEIVFYSYSLK